MNIQKGKSVAVIMFILLLIVVAAGYYFLYMLKAHEPFTPGHNLTEEQVREAVDIAFKNSTVKSEIEIVNNKYNITGVEVHGIRMHGTSNITYYPTVMIRLGDDPSFARGLYVYVDLYNRTVAYIAHPYYGPIPVKT